MKAGSVQKQATMALPIRDLYLKKNKIIKAVLVVFFY